MKTLELEVQRADDELARARAWYALADRAVDDDHIKKLVAAADSAHAALTAAIPAALSPQQGQTPMASGGTLMGAATTQLVATVTLRMDRLATSLAHLHALRGTPLVSVRVENKSADKQRRVSVHCYLEGYSAEAIASGELGIAGNPDASATFDLFPPVFPGKTRDLDELTAAALHVRVDDLDSGKPELIMARPIPLLPPTSAVLGYKDPQTGATVDQRELLAAFVTPNAPVVLNLLRAAVDVSKLKAMLGYQTYKPDDVREQVRAIYTALAKADIVYVDTRIAFGAVAGETIQRIRLPRESVERKSANCIDGTVLIASLLEATGLDPFIVIVPGHAFLGYRLTPGAPPEQAEYVETTVLSTKSFDDAVKLATDRSQTTTSILRLDVRALRAQGITPME